MQDRSTDFEFLPIDVSLGRCQRYFELFDAGASNTNYAIGFARTTTTQTYHLNFKVSKRAVDWSGSISGTLSSEIANVGADLSSPTFFNGFNGGGRLNMTSASSMTLGIGCALVANSAKILISSEL